MTSAEAVELHQRVSAGGAWCVWFVSLSDPARPGKAVAWAMVADGAGGTRQEGELIADTLADLRAMLPPGLTLWNSTAYTPSDVAEVWG